VSTDAEGIPHRALSLRTTYALSIARLTVSLTISNHSTRHVDADVAWVLDADFADIQEAHEGKRDQPGDVRRQTSGDGLTFTYQHPQLKYRTAVAPMGSTPWTVSDSMIKTRVRLEPQEAVVLGLQVDPSDTDGDVAFNDAEAREQHLRTWQERLTRVAIPANRVAERILDANVRDFASFPLLEGPPDEWLTL
jgi:N-terminal domain of (some) glycogen debranching enzymes